METDGGWTLDELVQLVGDALAGTAYPGAPNGRVRDVPDRRSVRWYATIGLVDRPVASAGRTARYGMRHLLQLVALKRRQAQGRTLAEIQAELAGATDATLRRVADLPHGWPTPPAAATAARPTPTPTPPAAASAARPAPAGGGRTRFWAAPPPAPPASPAAAAAEPPAEADPTLLAGIPLGAGAVLLLPAHPGPDDLRAIHAAVRPLLDLLADRGLLDTTAKPVGPAAGERLSEAEQECPT